MFQSSDYSVCFLILMFLLKWIFVLQEVMTLWLWLMWNVYWMMFSTNTLFKPPSTATSEECAEELLVMFDVTSDWDDNWTQRSHSAVSEFFFRSLRLTDDSFISSFSICFLCWVCFCLSPLWNVVLSRCIILIRDWIDTGHMFILFHLSA